MIKSMFRNEDAAIAESYGIQNDLTINDGKTVVIFHSEPNMDGSLSKFKYSVGRCYKAKMLGCRIWGATSQHRTMEAAIAAAKKLDRKG